MNLTQIVKHELKYVFVFPEFCSEFCSEFLGIPIKNLTLLKNACFNKSFDFLCFFYFFLLFMYFISYVF